MLQFLLQSTCAVCAAVFFVLQFLLQSTCAVCAAVFFVLQSVYITMCAGVGATVCFAACAASLCSKLLCAAVWVQYALCCIWRCSLLCAAACAAVWMKVARSVQVLVFYLAWTNKINPPYVAVCKEGEAIHWDWNWLREYTQSLPQAACIWATLIAGQDKAPRHQQLDCEKTSGGAGARWSG
jgi:hypothetical protein